MRICIYQCKHFGDALLTTPLIVSISKTFPEAQLVIVCSKATIPIFQGLPRVVDVLSKPSTLIEWFRLIRVLSSCDVIFMPHSSSVPIVLGSLLRIPTVADGGYSIKFFGSATFGIPKPLTLWRHAADKNLDLLRRYAGPLAKVEKRIACRHLLTENSRSVQFPAKTYIVCHPGTRWMFKTPGFYFWNNLLECLVDAGCHVVLTGLLQGEEGDLLKRLHHERGRAVFLQSETSLSGLATVIDNAKAYIGVDTFATHLAAALGVPGLAIYGPTSELRWGPYGDLNQLEVVCSEHFSCRPCHVDGCGGGKVSECLTSIDSNEVANRFLNKLQEI